MAEQLELSMKITADFANAKAGLTSFTTNVKQVSGASQELSGKAGQSAAALSKMGDSAAKSASHYTKTAQGLKSISGQLENLKLAGMAFVSFNKIAGGAGSLIALADEYGQMASRIKMATSSAQEYQEVQAHLLETANNTYRPLKEAQEMYIRTSDALKSMGYNTQQALDVTDSLSYLMVKNAASGERAESALSAFTTSLQTGQVHAMQWKTILAAVPSIVEDIARATGKTREEIRQLGAEGKLAAAELTEGLRKSAGGNQMDAAAMPTTVKDAFTSLTNAIQVYVGEANQAAGAVIVGLGLATLKASMLAAAPQNLPCPPKTQPLKNDFAGFWGCFFWGIFRGLFGAGLWITLPGFVA